MHIWWWRPEWNLENKTVKHCQDSSRYVKIAHTPENIDDLKVCQDSSYTGKHWRPSTMMTACTLCYVHAQLHNKRTHNLPTHLGGPMSLTKLDTLESEEQLWFRRRTKRCRELSDSNYSSRVARPDLHKCYWEGTPIDHRPWCKWLWTHLLSTY